MTINERFEEIIKVLFGGNKRALLKPLESTLQLWKMWLVQERVNHLMMS